MSDTNYGIRVNKDEVDEDEFDRMKYYVILSLLSALGSILFVPFILGPIGIISSRKIIKNWSSQLGWFILGVCFVCMLVGLIVEILTSSGNLFVTIG